MKRMSFVLSIVAAAFVATAIGCSNETATPASPAAKPVETATPAPVAPTPPPAATTTTPTTEAPSTATPVAGVHTFTLTPDSEITWAMEVTGSFGVGTRKGGWAIYDGTIEVDGENFETAKINVEVDMASAYSDDNTLTKKLQGEEHFFLPAKFPKSTFKSTAIKKMDAGYDVTGDFTIKDKTKSITFPAVVKFDGNKLTADTKFEMNRQDFGINYDGSVGDFMIKDNAVIEFKIVAEVQ